MGKRFSNFATLISNAAGHWSAFILALLAILTWAIAGPLVGFGETWMLWINTGTTIITFLLVFVIQHTQNKDSIAIHAKVDELIRAIEEADDEYRHLEEADEDRLKQMRER